MAGNPKTDVLITPYQRQVTPPDISSLPTYLMNELKRLQTTITDLTDAAPQAAYTAPATPRLGMVRYAEGAWATQLGAVGLYVYKSTGWTKIV